MCNDWERCALLAKHPEYYAEIHAEMGGIFGLAAELLRRHIGHGASSKFSPGIAPASSKAESRADSIDLAELSAFRRRPDDLG